MDGSDMYRVEWETGTYDRLSQWREVVYGACPSCSSILRQELQAGQQFLEFAGNVLALSLGDAGTGDHDIGSSTSELALMGTKRFPD